MERLEELRTKIKSRYIKSFIITFVCISFFIIISLFIKYRGVIGLANMNSIRVYDILMPIFTPILASLFISLIIAIISTSKLTREFRKEFKEIFVLKALNQYFTDLVFDPNHGISHQVIADTHMMHMGDRYSSNDYISGKYKGIAFEQADVHIEEEHESTDSDGHTSTYYVTIFRGRWMIFDFNKNFKANVQISQKGFGNSYANTLWGNKESRFKKVQMESEEFNKRFNVYAQSEHDAFYIITPSFMQKIQKLDDQNKGKMLFCFIDNKLHIGLYDGKDAFEPGSVFKKLDEEKIINDISRDIETVTQFIDELNLDNSLFAKEV